MTNYDIYNMVQKLGDAGRYDIVEWFGDYMVYEKKLGIPNETIVEEYNKLLEIETEKKKVKSR